MVTTSNRGYRRLQWVTGVTEGCKRLQKVTRGLQRVPRGYRGLRGVTKN